MTGLVHGDGVAFPLDVLDVLGEAELLRMERISASLTRSLMVAPVA
jgi:hypothetical protein